MIGTSKTTDGEAAMLDGSSVTTVRQGSNINNGGFNGDGKVASLGS
jgi:hypothetical protein